MCESEGAPMYANTTNITNNESWGVDVSIFIVPIIFGIITLIGVIGNGLVIYIVIKFPSMHNVTNFYILNVAISSLIFVVVCAPSTSLLYILPDRWILGDFVCRLVAYTQYVSVQATCATLTAMTVDRYYVVSQPLKSRHERTPKIAVMISIVIWIGSFLLHVPIAMYFKQVTWDCNGYDIVICYEAFPSVSASSLYQAYSLVLVYLLPLAIIAVCYGFILKQIWKVEALGRSDGGLYDVKQSMNRRRKVTRMVLIVVMLFAISWGPLQAMNTWARFDSHYPFNSFHFQNFRVFCLCLAYSNACVNPFVYAFMGKTYKKYFKRLFRISDENSRLARFHTMQSTTLMRQNSKKQTEKSQETSI